MDGLIEINPPAIRPTKRGGRHDDREALEKGRGGRDDFQSSYLIQKKIPSKGKEFFRIW